MDAIIFDSALSHTRRLDASEKETKIACPFLDVNACGQVSNPPLYRLEVFEKNEPKSVTGAWPQGNNEALDKHIGNRAGQKHPPVL